MSSDSPALVARRLVVALYGYEPVEASYQHGRFRREAARCDTTWGVSTTVGEASPDRDGHVLTWPVATRAPNWRVETEYRFLSWSDIVRADFARSDPVRVATGLAALFDFIVTGVLFRYFRTNWRYALFFLYPLALLGGILALGIVAGRLVLASGIPAATVLSPVSAVAAVLLFWRLARDRLYLAYILDDWHFAADLVHGRRPDLDARLDLFARDVVEAVGRTDADEVVLVGHSLGAALMLMVIERALASDPDLATRRPRFALLTVGSSILKVGLHPAATAVRRAATRVTGEPALFWVEFQALRDVINFFRCNPATDMGVTTGRPPEVRTFSIKRMLDPAYYRRAQWDFFRMHRQFVMGNERRHNYDYHLIVGGPIALKDRVERPDETITGFGPAGELLPPWTGPAQGGEA